MGLCSSYPNDAIGQQSSAESALSEGRHTSPECNCPRKSLWHGQSGHQHHQRLLSIQKKDLIPENRTKAAWRILHLGCPFPLRAQLWSTQNCSFKCRIARLNPDNKATLVAMAGWWVISNKAGP